MTKRIGTNVNVNSGATITTVVVNSTTSTIWSSTNTDPNTPPKIPGFTKMTITNEGIRPAYIKLQAASVDNDLKGILIPRNETRDIMLDGDVCTDEISARTSFGIATLHLTVY